MLSLRYLIIVLCGITLFSVVDTHHSRAALLFCRPMFQGTKMVYILMRTILFQAICFGILIGFCHFRRWWRIVEILKIPTKNPSNLMRYHDSHCDCRQFIKDLFFYACRALVEYNTKKGKKRAKYLYRLWLLYDGFNMAQSSLLTSRKFSRFNGINGEKKIAQTGTIAYSAFFLFWYGYIITIWSGNSLQIIVCE